MKTIRIIGEARTDLGTASAKILRENGQVPCVLYGKENHVHFAVYRDDFKNLVYTPNSYLAQIEVNGKKYTSILQEIQFHPVNDQITHVDFLEVSTNNPITIHLPIKITGNSPGVREGGKLLVKIKKLRVKGLIKDMPDFIEVNIDTLELGKSVKVGDLNLPNVDLLDSKANAIASVVATRATKEAAVEAAKK